MSSTLRYEAPVTTLVRIALEAGLFFVVSLAVTLMDSKVVVPVASDALAPALMFAALTVTANTVLGLYAPEGPWSVLSSLARLLVGMLVALPCAYLALQFIPHANTEWLAPRAIAAVAIVVSIRQAALFVMSARMSGHRVLILGLGRTAQAVGTALAETGSVAIKLVGYYPVRSREDIVVPPNMILQADAPLATIIAREQVDEVIVALQDQRGGALPVAELLNCRLSGVKVTELSQFFERTRGEVPVQWLKASYLIFGEGFRQSLGRTFVKRTFDILGAMLLFLIAAPVMFVTALMIRLESPGPIIYRQERVGRGGRVFKLLKFRSMRTDAEADGRPRWARANDSRVTRVGRFIRATRIDELPQLINVLRGEMSFVGPRPERPYFVEQLTEQIPFYAARHSVKPGITGWAQVRFPYGASVEDATRKLEYDLYYVKNHSWIFDLVILVQTIRVVFLREGSR